MSLSMMESVDVSAELKTALDTAPWRKRTSSSASGSPTSISSAGLVVKKASGKRVSFDIPCNDEPLDDDSNVSTVDTVETDPTAAPFDGDAEQQLEQWYVQVAIGNIPTNLLVNATMQVMLEQTVSENALISFKMYQGTRSGSVTAFFASVQDAQYCVNHFNGRRWDRKAMPVTAEIVSMPWASPMAPTVDPVQAQIAKLLEEAAMHMQMSQIYASNAAFVAEVEEPKQSESAVKVQKMKAPCKIPLGANAEEEDLPFLSAESPAFICMTGAGKQSFGSCSEISTESGESGESGESENEQSSEVEEETASVH